MSRKRPTIKTVEQEQDDPIPVLPPNPTYEQFDDWVQSVLLAKREGLAYQYNDRYPLNQQQEKESYLWVRWVTGGTTGGSCWGGELYNRSSEPAQDLTSLDTILEYANPTITFLQYKKLIREIVQTRQETDWEYYGNNSEYTYLICKVEDLYNYLKSEKWI